MQFTHGMNANLMENMLFIDIVFSADVAHGHFPC